MGISINSLKTHLKLAIKTMRNGIKTTMQFTLLFIIRSYVQSYNKTGIAALRSHY